MKYAFLALSYWTLGYLLPTLPVSLRWPLAILVILLSFIVLVYRVDTYLNFLLPEE